MDQLDNEINGNQGVKPRPVCPKCGATFKDRRGLNGHMAGKHGSKYGLNATVDSLVNEVHELNIKIDNLINELRQGIQQRGPFDSRDYTAIEPHESLEIDKPETKLPSKEPKPSQKVEGTQLPLE